MNIYLQVVYTQEKWKYMYAKQLHCVHLESKSGLHAVHEASEIVCSFALDVHGISAFGWKEFVAFHILKQEYDPQSE